MKDEKPSGQSRPEDEQEKQARLNLEAAEHLLIRRALTAAGGNIADAARRLGINRARIYRHLGPAKG